MFRKPQHQRLHRRKHFIIYCKQPHMAISKTCNECNKQLRIQELVANNNISHNETRDIVKGNSYAKFAAGFTNVNQESDFLQINRKLLQFKEKITPQHRFPIFRATSDLPNFHETIRTIEKCIR